MAYHHISELKSKSVAKGVEEIILLSENETSSKKLKVKSITAKPESHTVANEFRGDIMCYIISGKGILTITQLKADWKYPVNNDTAIWVPPLSKYSIENTSDGELRYIEFSTAISENEDISEIVGQHLVRVVERLNCLKSTFIHYYEHTLFTKRSEQRKLLWGGYHTLFPKGYLPRHYENLDCEETMYVTRGRGKMTSGDSEYEVKPGSLVYVPSRTLHSIQNSSENDSMEVLLYESHP